MENDGDVIDVAAVVLSLETLASIASPEACGREVKVTVIVAGEFWAPSR